MGPPLVIDPPQQEEKQVSQETKESPPPKEEKVIAVVYVTDKLILGMKDNPEGKGKNLKLLRSGTKLEVLERQGPFSKVRTPEGLVGWAKTTFMVKDKPAILQVETLKDENKELRKEIERLKKSTQSAKEPEKVIEVQANPEQKQRLLELEMALEEAKKQLEEQENQLAERQATSDHTQVVRPSLKWLIFVFLAGLVTGSAYMFYHFQQRMRKRFAGMKV